ncbi:PrpF domain-containing protein [Desmospora activa]|uniref:PrpF protein n=1 Tax=Desmospora activa DSM 45169 TaxID=1121389 RepID=A0A2T4Z7A4_9BACL|nr:PrpF domain-containing protein [Desmospora activa]PTM57771.1 hypothetical protein C8J48_0325 [Desmospora activa DSM 45169]
MSQFTVPCAVYRGGTSRGLFFHKHDLPEEMVQQKKIFMAGIDAYNPSQIDGLGAGTSHSSKVCVISPSTMGGADVDFTFYQIGIGEEVVDDRGTCGNLMAGVGAFAVDEGYVQVDPSDREVKVSIFNTNIGKTLHITVPVVNGKAKVTGNFLMPGLHQAGAKYSVDILSPGGGKTGSTLPLGVKATIATESRTYEVSFIDIVNPFVFVSAADLGLKGTEPNSALAADAALLQELENIRLQAAVAAGMAQTAEEAKQTPAIPKIALVTHPQDYTTSAGKAIKAEDVDVVAKMLSMGKFHRTFAGSGFYCIAAAALILGTIPNRYTKKADATGTALIRMGHPEGVTEVRAALMEDGSDVALVGIDRTARRIMKGELYIPA